MAADTRRRHRRTKPRGETPAEFYARLLAGEPFPARKKSAGLETIPLPGESFLLAGEAVAPAGATTRGLPSGGRKSAANGNGEVTGAGNSAQEQLTHDDAPARRHEQATPAKRDNRWRGAGAPTGIRLPVSPRVSEAAPRGSGAGPRSGPPRTAAGRRAVAERTESPAEARWLCGAGVLPCRCALFGRPLVLAETRSCLKCGH